MVPTLPSAKKQAEDAKQLAKLLLRIETNLKARNAMQNDKGNLKIATAAG
jgi:hypothetical protein